MERENLPVRELLAEGDFSFDSGSRAARQLLDLAEPVTAIIAVSIVTAALGATLDFDRLADVSNVAVVAQYISTSFAIMIWQQRDPGGARFRLPFGPLIPILGIGGSVLFLFHVSRVELLFGAALLAGGLAFGLLTRFFRRARVPSA